MCVSVCLSVCLSDPRALLPQVRMRPEFRFDWVFKSRTPIELGRRVDLLIRIIKSEGQSKDKPAKKQKAAEDDN